MSRHPRFAIRDHGQRYRLALLIGGCFLIAACAAEPTLPPPAISTATAPRATSTALPPTATASATTVPTSTQSPTPSHTETPTLTPTATLPPVPTVDLNLFPLPPASFGGEAHLFLARPLGAGGNVFPASTYRYGSTRGNQLQTHHGLDFGNPSGTPVVAVAPGSVFYAGSDAELQFGPYGNFYGNTVVLQLAQAWQGRTVYALYGHMETLAVSNGQAVNTGDVLGTVGATGIAGGPHLHLEVRLDKPDSYWDTRNPELWLIPASGTGAIAVRVTNDNGQYLPGRRVDLLCSDGARRFVDTYWDPGVTPDDLYGENGALTDVPAGYCKLETNVNGKTLASEITVQAGTVNFVWLKP